LVGEASAETPSTPTADSLESRLLDFLSPAKQEQLRRLLERYQAQVQATGQANISQEEKASQLAQLRREMESEEAKILSPDELAEYQLRQSSAAKEVQQFYGVDFTETELRNMAKAIDDYHHLCESQSETDPQTLEQNLQTVLGARFGELVRARSASYREIYELVSDLSQPAGTAAQIFDLRLESEKQSDEIRADRNRSPEEKQALLDELYERLEESLRSQLGAEGYQIYKARHGLWISGVGRL
jgi:hypothetical protein